MEDDVYVCSWSRSREAYELWLKSNPKIRGCGATYGEAERALIDAIQDSGGAMRAVLEFDPPLPPADNVRDFLTTSIVTIWGDERFEQGGPPRNGVCANAEERDAYLLWDDQHYEGGWCRACRAPRGPRTDRPLELSYIRSGYGGGFVSIAGGTSYVFSEKFLDLLTKRERASLELRQVIRPRRSRVACYELIGPPGPPLVGLKDVLPHSGWECDECGYRRFGYSRTGFDLHSFLAKEDLPNPMPGIFTVGLKPDVQLAATSQRWAELVGQKGTRGMLAEPLGVVPPERVDREPPLRKLSELDPEVEARKREYWRKQHFLHEQRMRKIREQRDQ